MYGRRAEARRIATVKNLTAPRGTFDILPPESSQWQVLERIIDEVCARFGYREIRTPIFESSEVFVRTIGVGTDIVDKEMYTFIDRGGRSISLRPEMTAPVVRAALAHNLLQTLPLKLYYRGPIFRYERPQKGRYRQAHQWGVECFGAAGPEADAEIIALSLEMMRAVGIVDYRLEINSLGCAQCAPAFREALVAYLSEQAAALSETSRERLQRNPLRILDSKDDLDRAVLAGAPTMERFLCESCQQHFADLRFLLESMGIRALHNPHIVRGLDYYTRTVFEIHSVALGAQDSVCGGGRYDGLVQAMGGPPTPGVGVAMGMDRMLMLSRSSGAAAEQDGQTRLQVAFVALDDESARLLVPVLQAVRARGIAADMDYLRRKLERQLRAAGESGARFAVIMGEDERTAGDVTIQDLATRARVRVGLTRVDAELAQRLA
ncbi:MAG: histidine--tRNA ligase [Candidatus Eremiobacter antarcticus]|nr:MAG: histidine--tRNA ligase [Candidatus Eremiobacter sp. RRmetagenome_bin22]